MTAWERRMFHFKSFASETFSLQGDETKRSQERQQTLRRAREVNPDWFTKLIITLLPLQSNRCVIYMWAGAPGRWINARGRHVYLYFWFRITEGLQGTRRTCTEMITFINTYWSRRNALRRCGIHVPFEANEPIQANKWIHSPHLIAYIILALTGYPWNMQDCVTIKAKCQ